MPAYWYVEEMGSAAMLAAKRSAGVTPEMNLGECVKTYASARHYFESQSPKQGLTVAPQKGSMSSKN